MTPSSFVTDAFTAFNKLLPARHQPNKSLKNFKYRFEALITHFIAHDASFIPVLLLALMLLFQANIEDNHKVSILAASMHKVSPNEADASAVDMMSKVE